MSEKILLIDIETTDLSPETGKIVEVGIVRLDLATGEKFVLLDQICWETGITRKEVEESWIVKNNYMSVEEIRRSMNFTLITPVIQKFIDLHPAGATAFNRNFDFNFLKSRGITFQKELACPMLLSTEVCKLPGKFGKFKWPKAEEAWNFFYPGADYKEKHRGADDAWHEADIVQALYREGIFKLD